MILVTGATGFIGRNLVGHLLEAGHQVMGTDRRPYPDSDGPKDMNFSFELADVEVPGTVRDMLLEHRPATVISLAEGIDRMVSVVEHGASAQGALLDAAEEAGVGRVIFASSIAVYMGEEGPFREDAKLPVDSVIHVGAIKKAAEQVAAWHNKHSQIETVALRLANIYGPHYHSMMNSPSRMLFAAMDRAIAGKVPAMPPSFYRMAADYCHVDDCCRAICMVVEAPELQHRIYNIGGGRGTTEEHVRIAVERACGRNADEVVRDSTENYLDITRIRDELGFYPRHDLDSGIAAYRNWLLHNDH